MPGKMQPTKPTEPSCEAQVPDVLPGPGPASSSSVVKCIGVVTLYIFVSASLINFNKYLMHKDRFPFALALTTFHMITTSVLCSILYCIKPSLYPTMAKTEGKRLTLLRWFIPLGLLISIGLSCSNKAYSFCTVAFLQMMKESNVAVVFGLAALAGLQQCTRSKLFVLAWILLGAFLAVRGEVHFVWIGFLIQIASQFGECGKTVLAEWIMNDGCKLDPLTFTMFQAPICLSILLVMTGLTWDHQVATQLKVWWPVLLPNACLAFSLNVMAAVVIKEYSAVTFMLIGLLKDMIIVCGCAVFLGELVVWQQFMGFAICLGGVAFWSLMRIDPSSSHVKNLQDALGEPAHAEKSELKQLLAKMRPAAAGP